MGLKIRKLSAKEIKARVGGCPGGGPLRWPWEAASEATQRWPAAQRVALARTLILEPNVVLFDEPLGSPDLKLRREMHIEIKNIQRRLGTRFVILTRDQQEALNMCDRIAIIKEGKIAQDGTAEEIYERPRTRFIADSIGDTNFFRR